MKDYMDAVKAAGIGRTPQLCQDALIEMREELFAGKTEELRKACEALGLSLIHI